MTDSAFREAILDRSPLLIYIAGADGSIQLLNRTFQTVTDFRKSELPTLDALAEKLYPEPSYQAAARNVHAGWAHNQHIEHSEMVVVDRHQNRHHIVWSSVPLPNAEGAIIANMAIGLDVTDARDAQRDRIHARGALQHAQDGFVVLDLANRIQEVSGAGPGLLGSRPGQYDGGDLGQLIKDDANRQAVEQALNAQEDFTGEIELTRADGKARKYHLFATTVFNLRGVPTGRIIRFSPPDPTNALQEQIAQLANERSKLSKDLEQAQQAGGSGGESAQVQALQKEVEDLKEQTKQALIELSQAHQQALRDKDADHEKRLVSLERDHAQEMEALEADLRQKAQTFAMEAQETSAKWRAVTEELEQERRSTGELEADLLALNSVAFVVAGTDGRVALWSAGAELLDGTSADKALGKLIHEEVMRLEGISWKDLFARSLIEGAITEPVVLDTSNERKEVIMELALVKDEKGKPIRVVEMFRPASANFMLERQLFRAKTASLVGEATRLTRAHLTSMVDTLATKAPKAIANASTMGKILTMYREGDPGQDIEDAVRTHDLPGILQHVEAMMSELDMSVKGVVQLERGLSRIAASGDGSRPRELPTELVDTMLSLVISDWDDIRIRRTYATVVPAVDASGGAAAAIVYQMVQAARQAALAADDPGTMDVEIKSGDQVTITLEGNGHPATETEVALLSDPKRPMLAPGEGPHGLNFVAHEASEMSGSFQVELLDGRARYTLVLPALSLEAAELASFESADDLDILEDDEEELKTVITGASVLDAADDKEPA